MFSPEASLASVHANSSHNPRRRQRTSDADSLNHQQPQKKRSKLSEETFIAPATGKLNGNGHLGSLNGHAKPRQSSLRTSDIPVRDKKRTGNGQRGLKNDGQVVLTKNPNFSIQMLPGYPAQLRQNPNEPYRASVLPSTPYALTLTHDTALVWDYTTFSQTPTPYTLKLPNPSKKNEPLPVGAIVRSGSSTEIGLVVISPISGKITFWDNVDSAETFTLFQQKRHSVEGIVTGQFSNEVVTDIIDAEHAGFVLTFNTGRLAQLTLRDTQGRPSISAQFIKNATNGGGLFGGLKSVLSGQSLKRAVAAVKTRQSPSKGHMEVVTVTKAGVFQCWDLSWAGQHVFKGELDTYAEVHEALHRATPAELRSQADEITFLDFSILSQPKKSSMDLVRSAPTSPLNVLAVVLLSGASGSSFALVEINLSDTMEVSHVIYLHSYDKPTELKDPYVQLLVPAPAHTALVLFKEAIVVASLDKPTMSPDDQLRGPLPSFQDTVYMRKGKSVRFVGYALETADRKDGSSSCAVFVQGHGVIRVTAFAPSEEEDLERLGITAKTRMEQAVFFSHVPENIIDFTANTLKQYSPDEIAAAAQILSSEILGSKSTYLPPLLHSMESHLSARSKALRALNHYLRSNCPTLDRVSRWKLLWDAEKLAGARAMWKTYDERLGQDHIKQRPLLAEIMELIADRYKTPLRTDIGELDHVRQWFFRDVAKIEMIIPWTHHAISELYKDGMKDRLSLIQLISEADDITLATMETAFEFRQENLEFYGLGSEDVQFGVLKSGYRGLPEFWTSIYNMLSSSRLLIDLARELATQAFETTASESNTTAAYARKVAMDAPRLVFVCCLVHIERYREKLEDENEAQRVNGQVIKTEFETKIRHGLLTRLSLVGQSKEGMEIAEKLHDMRSLAELVLDEISYFVTELEAAETEEQAKKCQETLDAMNARVQSYFKRFGDEWAEELYSTHIASDNLAALFKEQLNTQDSLTRFLRADKSRAKLAWINDVTGEKDFQAASKALKVAGTEQEENVWCKKVELSLAKLAQMAADGQATVEPKVERELELVGIQEELYTHFEPFISTATDGEAKIMLLMDTFAGHLQGQPAFGQLLKRGFEELCAHRAMDPQMLIDVLTLMDHAATPVELEYSELLGKEFHLALQVLQAEWDDMAPTTRDYLLRLVWKRAFIADDWERVNASTSSQAESVMLEQVRQTVLFRTLYEGAKATNNYQLPTPVAPLHPVEVLGAGCDAKDLATRFPLEDLREPIIRDNEADERALDLAIKEHRLSHWFQVAKHEAASLLKEEREEAAREALEVEGVEGDDAAAVVVNGVEGFETVDGDVEME